MAQRRVRRECGEPATDDRAAHDGVEGTSHVTRAAETGLAPLLDPGLVPVRAQEVILRLLGQIAVLRRVGLDPAEACPGVGEAPVIDVGEAEHRRQEQPLAAAVVLVVQVAVHAAVDEERLFDALDDLRGADEEQRSVEPVAGAGERLAPDLVGVEAVAHAPERRRVNPLALLPPVDARLGPVVLEPARDERRGLFPARVVAAAAQRAEEEAEPVDLQLRPLGRVGLAVERVARVPRPGRAREDRVRAPVEESVGALAPGRARALRRR